MPPRPSHQQLLLRVLRHLVLVLGGMLGARMDKLRAWRDALPANHRRRARMTAQLRRLARLRALLDDPDVQNDAAFRGKAAEVARVRNDAGRWALARRYRYPTPLVRLRGALPAASVRAEEARCIGGSGVALALPGGIPGGGAGACTAWAGLGCVGFAEPGLDARTRKSALCRLKATRARRHTGAMISRRATLALPFASALVSPGLAATPQEKASFDAFVAGLRADAARSGIKPATLDRAFIGVQPNQRVIELDRKQPEFTLTWDQYRTRVISDARIAKGRGMFAQHRDLLARVTARYGVPAAPIMGIWGLESDYGASTGGFHVIEALATLAWEGRRAAFFRSELMDALKIIQAGDITPERMTGSYAGAMGQPQFMPDSYLKFAQDFSGNGKRDIWSDPGDIFASVANYLAKSGWSDKLPWGVAARLPAGFDAALAGRDNRRKIEEWARLGVRPARPLAADAMAAVILPGGPQGEAYFACHPNFLAIRRYNPSDFYCISVGLIGERVTA